MSQYGGQQAYAPQQQAPQYGGQTVSQQDPSLQYGGQTGGQQDPSLQYGGQTGSQQDSSIQYGGQQDVSQYGGKQDTSIIGGQQASQLGGQIGVQDSSSQYGGLQQGQSKYGQQENQSGSMSGINDINGQQGQLLQGLGQQYRGGNKQGSGERKQNEMINGHKSGYEDKENKYRGQYGAKREERKDEDYPKKAMMRGAATGEVRRRGRQEAGAGQRYHHTHLNALHHMGKAAAHGFTPEHIDSLLHLVTYGAGTLANTHGLAPAEPVPEED